MVESLGLYRYRWYVNDDRLEFKTNENNYPRVPRYSVARLYLYKLSFPAGACRRALSPGSKHPAASPRADVDVTCPITLLNKQQKNTCLLAYNDVVLGQQRVSVGKDCMVPSLCHSMSMVLCAISVHTYPPMIYVRDVDILLTAHPPPSQLFSTHPSPSSPPSCLGLIPSPASLLLYLFSAASGFIQNYCCTSSLNPSTTVDVVGQLKVS